MARVHHFIVEFMRYTNGTFKNALGRFVNSYGVMGLFLLLPLILSTERLSKTFEWATLCFSFFFCYLLLVATWFQIRWSGLFSIGLAVLVVVTLNAGWRAAVEKRVGIWFPVSALILVVFQIGFYGWEIRHDVPNTRKGLFLTSNLTNPAQMRTLADAIKKLHPEGPVNIMCDPDYSPSLAYFKAAHGVSSFYWENVEGLHRTTRFFTALDDDEAQQILARSNIQYVIVPAEPSFEKGCIYIRYGLSRSAPAPERTLLGRLYAKDPEVLKWLQRNEVLSAAASKELSLRGSIFRNPIDVYDVRIRGGHAAGFSKISADATPRM